MSIMIAIYRVTGRNKQVRVASGEVETHEINRWLRNRRSISAVDTSQPGRLLLETIDTSGCYLTGIERDAKRFDIGDGFDLWRYELTGPQEELLSAVDQLACGLVEAGY